MKANRILLLVSPRNIDEALEVIKSKADIVDCKNPLEGSLGANHPGMIRDMKNLVVEKSNKLLSATIGDFPHLPCSAALAALGAAYSGADIIKVGIMGSKNLDEAVSLMKSVVNAVKDYNKRILVVAAGYADQKRLNTSPDPLLIPDIAAKANCDIAMIDTAIKDGKGLFDFLNVESLIDFKNKAKKNNLTVALAGNLKLKDIKIIKEIGPDIIGVRSIVCTNNDRNNGEIREYLIEKLWKELN
jgi:uncharacterized protein (UPF0264 family)